LFFGLRRSTHFCSFLRVPYDAPGTGYSQPSSPGNISAGTPILERDFSRRLIYRDFLIMPRLPGKQMDA